MVAQLEAAPVARGRRLSFSDDAAGGQLVASRVEYEAEPTDAAVFPSSLTVDGVPIHTSAIFKTDSRPFQNRYLSFQN